MSRATPPPLRRALGVSCWLVALWLLCGSGCFVSYQREGQSSREIKKDLQGSYLMRGARIFYPQGVPKDPADLPELGAEQIKEIQRVFDLIVGNIEQVHASQADVLSRFFERPVPKELHVRVKVTSMRAAFAEIESQGRLSVDVQVAQAFYRTAVIAGMSDVLAEDWSRDETSGKGKDLTEVELLKEFFAVVVRMNALSERSSAGEAWDLARQKDQSTDWFEAVHVRRLAETIDKHYGGTIAFMLAHEIGHQALGHFARPRLRDDDCASFQALELEADAYAVVILLMGHEDAQRCFEDFFRHTYELSGFSKLKPENCSHPAPGDRRSRAEALRSSLLEAGLDFTWRQALLKPLASKTPDGTQ